MKKELPSVMTVRDALDEMRLRRNGTVVRLVLCKYELFYMPLPKSPSPSDSVYPVTMDLARQEAEYFGCDVSEE
jgi:hypothetical protein